MLEGAAARISCGPPEGALSWVLRFMLDRKPRYMGLGPLSLYGLADARARALEAKRKRHDGTDPITARRAERARQRLASATAFLSSCPDIAAIY